jgi:copper chaperone CopZ
MFRLNELIAIRVLAMALILSGASSALAATDGPFYVQIVASEMCCKGCAQTVAAQLYSLPGVTDVRADVPNRLVSVTAKPSAKLTLERIWQAVEKGKGRPSKLVTRQATYVMSPQQSLKPEQRLPAGRYSLLMSSIENRDTAQRVADELYKIGGVQRVSVDIAQSTFFVQSANGVSISPWALATAAERAQGEPVSIGGPYGLLTIERPVESKAAAAGVPAYPVNQGVGR